MANENKLQAIDKIEQENNLTFRWTKHIFLLANVLMILGIAISWIVIANVDNPTYPFLNKCLPVLILTLVSLGFWYLSFHFCTKDIKTLSASVPGKYLKLFRLSNILYIMFIFLSSAMFVIFNIFLADGGTLKTETSYIISISISGALSIVVVTINKYSLFMIEYEIYKKRYGEKH